MAPRRVRRNKKQEKTYKELTDKSEFGIFDSYKDVFMVSGVIGFLNGKRVSFEESSEGIAWSVFNLDTDLTVINAVALCENEDPNILLKDEEAFDEKLKIYEEYAAGGLPILYEKVMSNKKFVSQNYFDLIMEMQNQEPESAKGIEKIMGDLSFN